MGEGDKERWWKGRVDKGRRDANGAGNERVAVMGVLLERDERPCSCLINPGSALR